MMEKDREMEVLKTIGELSIPAGAIYLSQELQIPQGSMGRILSGLESAGLIEKVSNKGRRLTAKGAQFLADYQRRNSQLESARNLILLTEEISKERLLEILEVRKLLECSAIQDTCRNITEEQMKALDTLLLENIYVVKHGGTGNREDLHLHLAIAEYSGNQTIYQILNLVLTQNEAYVKFTKAAGPDENYQIKEHENIVAAILKRDQERARSAMEKHLDKVMADVVRAYE